jgi:hypothetical protein
VFEILTKISRILLLLLVILVEGGQMLWSIGIIALAVLIIFLGVALLTPKAYLYHQKFGGDMPELKPSEFVVFNGSKRLAGIEVLKFFHFDPDKCKIEELDGKLRITQTGHDELVIEYWQKV